VEEDMVTQNVVAQKVIFYMQLFSEELQQQLAKAKSL
jgi:hypothetical protein